ncbi:MAG: hypothetical protein BroJett038_12780 [Chloroflexota bacterium]|nr:MAG: hypothetical protein BroJett038_12780 [Chloroflexota bacterium]
MQDIVFLVADADTEQAIIGLLSRTLSLGIRDIKYQIYKHDRRDPGCRTEADIFLRQFVKQFDYAIVLFDHEGCGQEQDNIETIQDELERRLTNTGWENRNRVVVIKPELEIWVWSDSPKVDECLGWANHQPALRTWLQENQLLRRNEIKPKNPKEAVEKSLREVRKPRSAAIYKQIAESVSLSRCNDPSFERLKSTLQAWFPRGNINP